MHARGSSSFITANMMKKYLCIYLPQWSINVAEREMRRRGGAPERGDKQHGDRQALLLTAQSGRQPVVKRCCHAAEAAGVEPEMPLVLAQAMIPAATIAAFEPRRDLRALYRLGVWAMRFSPSVGLDNELLRAFREKRLDAADPRCCGLILDLSGTERLHHGTDNLARRLLQKFSRWGIEARLAIAPTIGAAWALSRYAQEALTIAKGPLEEEIGLLPVRALRISKELSVLLQQLGIVTIYDLLQLPRAKLPVRFGAELLQRLDQALGASAEGFRAIHPAIRFSAQRFFETPCTRHVQVQKVLQQLLAEVMAQLSEKRKKAGYFILKLQGIDAEFRNTAVLKRVALYAATASASHIAAVLQPVIEKLPLPYGVYGFTVTACSISTIPASQHRFLEHTADIPAHAKDELLNHLVVRVGEENLKRLQFNQSYVPERAYSYPTLDRGGRAAVEAPAAVQQIKHARPSYLLASPEEIEVIALLPDRPPSQIRWRGELHRIVKGTGPERISPEWWQAGDAGGGDRDYFTVQDDVGRWLWVFRDNARQVWFLHGVWT